MTSGGNSFNDFPKLYQPEKSQQNIDKTFLVRGRGLCLERAYCSNITSTILNPALATN